MWFSRENLQISLKLKQDKGSPGSAQLNASVCPMGTGRPCAIVFMLVTLSSVALEREKMEGERESESPCRGADVIRLSFRKVLVQFWRPHRATTLSGRNLIKRVFSPDLHSRFPAIALVRKH